MDIIEYMVPSLKGAAIEAVTELYDRLGLGGTVQEYFVVQGQEADFSIVNVKTYLAAEDEIGQREIEIGLELLRCLWSLPEVSVRRLSEKDWSEAWKEFYHPRRIGRHLLIKPTWEDVNWEPGEIVIEMDPGMAFGTGMHATTRLCLEALEKYLTVGACVLDVGTGSGILAIAAAKLGAKSVAALDIDPLAINVARENARLNKAEHRLRLFAGTLPQYHDQYPDARHDLVLSNILLNTIIELLPLLLEQLAPGGHLILSGFILEQKEDLFKVLRIYGLQIKEILSEDNWLAIVATC